jgi:hypothetical protein
MPDHTRTRSGSNQADDALHQKMNGCSGDSAIARWIALFEYAAIHAAILILVV